MSFLALIMGAILSGTTIVEYGKQPLDYGLADKVSIRQIEHTGFSSEDQRQLMVDKAYQLGGIDFVVMIECENGNRNVNAVGDGGHAFGLCQMNNMWHNIPQEYYENWEYQIDYCYNKWKGGTKFYGPTRKIKGQYCKDYVKDRFIISF